MKNPIELSIVIPAYREFDMIGPTLTETANFLTSLDMIEKTELIIVAADGGDGTVDVAQQHSTLFENFSVIELGPRVGKGRDVRAGMQAASGDNVMFMDADLATPLHHIELLLDRLRTGSDIVIGVRDLDAKHEDIMRRATSKISNYLIRFVAVPGVKDTQCGFKGFRAEIADDLFTRQTILGWGFDIEILTMAQLYGYSIVQMSIDDWFDPKGEQGLVGDSHFAALFQTLQELLRVRINIWKGLYK